MYFIFVFSVLAFVASVFVHVISFTGDANGLMDWAIFLHGAAMLSIGSLVLPQVLKKKQEDEKPPEEVKFVKKLVTFGDIVIIFFGLLSIYCIFNFLGWIIVEKLTGREFSEEAKTARAFSSMWMLLFYISIIQWFGKISTKRKKHNEAEDNCLRDMQNEELL